VIVKDKLRGAMVLAGDLSAHTDSLNIRISLKSIFRKCVAKFRFFGGKCANDLLDINWWGDRR
jgi:hypothetical protein